MMNETPALTGSLQSVQEKTWCLLLVVWPLKIIGTITGVSALASLIERKLRERKDREKFAGAIAEDSDPEFELLDAIRETDDPYNDGETEPSDVMWQPASIHPDLVELTSDSDDE